MFVFLFFFSCITAFPTNEYAQPSYYQRPPYSYSQNSYSQNSHPSYAVTQPNSISSNSFLPNPAPSYSSYSYSPSSYSPSASASLPIPTSNQPTYYQPEQRSFPAVPPPSDDSPALRIATNGYYIQHPVSDSVTPEFAPGASYYPDTVIRSANISTSQLYSRPYQGHIYESIYPMNSLPATDRVPVKVEVVGHPVPYTPENRNWPYSETPPASPRPSISESSRPNTFHAQNRFQEEVKEAENKPEDNLWIVADAPSSSLSSSTVSRDASAPESVPSSTVEVKTVEAVGGRRSRATTVPIANQNDLPQSEGVKPTQQNTTNESEVVGFVHHVNRTARWVAIPTTPTPLNVTELLDLHQRLEANALAVHTQTTTARPVAVRSGPSFILDRRRKASLANPADPASTGNLGVALVESGQALIDSEVADEGGALDTSEDIVLELSSEELPSIPESTDTNQLAPVEQIVPTSTPVAMDVEATGVPDVKPAVPRLETVPESFPPTTDSRPPYSSTSNSRPTYSSTSRSAATPTTNSRTPSAPNEGFRSGLLPFDDEEVQEEQVSYTRLGRNATSSDRMSRTSVLQRLERLAQPVVFSEIGDGATPHPAKDVYAYCYPFTYDEIVTKCVEAKKTNAVGVYIPMMMEIQQAHEDIWYAKIRQLKQTSGLEIIGIAYEKPDWNLITQILTKNQGLFSGVLLEWIGPEACISAIPRPTENHLKVLEIATTRNTVLYFVREQNFEKCQLENPDFIGEILWKDAALTDLKKLVPNITPVFACFGGQEGLCFKAFNQHPREACGDGQRFSFNPYENAGGRMMHLVNETCAGLPPHDLYGTL